MVANASAILAIVLVLLAEVIHARRRVRSVAQLAFGPTGRPRAFVPWVIPARAIGAGAIVWGLITLMTIDPALRKVGDVPDAALKRLIIALDVSPSMKLKDAGPQKNQPRADRAAEVVMSVLDRISLEQTRVTVIAFYTGARPVVIDTRDPAVVKNIMSDLPLEMAFDPGKTNLLDGITKAFEIAKPWREKSATLLLVSDGDTVSQTGIPAAPPAIARSIVIGVGDVAAGKFVDDHNSRQDVSTLRQVATRLRGVYHNANDRNVPADLIADVSGLLPINEKESSGRRELALAATGFGGFLIAAVPLAVTLFGSAWRPGRRAGAIARLDPTAAASFTTKGVAHA